MTTDQSASSADDTTPPPEPAPRWWQRDHATFIALSGFFSGLVFVIVVPGAFAGVLRLLFAEHTAEDLFPLVLVIFVVPIALMVVERTRRFGIYLALGMIVTALVVVGVASAVLWLLFR